MRKELQKQIQEKVEEMDFLEKNKTDKPRTKEQLLKEINDRIVYFYARIDGGFDFPNSRDGDLLKMVKKYIDMANEENKNDI